METISVTIPRETEALIKTADYLRSLAGVEQGVTIESEPPLDPQKEADAMEKRMDNTIAAAGTAVEPTNPLEVDSDGTPWDVRIHSGGKTFMQSGPKVGTWKLKKGVDPVLVEQVKAEVPAAVAPVEVPAAVAPVEVPAAAALPAEVSAALPVTTYTGLIQLITERQASGENALQQNDVLDAIKASGAGASGVRTLPELAPVQFVTFIPLVAEELRKIWVTRV